MKKFLILSGILSLTALSFAKEVVAPPIIKSEVPVQAAVVPTPVVSAPVIEEVPVPGNFAMYMVDRFTELKAVPSFSLGAPVGMVPGYGVVFAGLSGRKTSGSRTDGAFAMGMGFGDPVKSLGGAATLALGSIDPKDGGAGNRGTLNLSTGKHFPAYGLGVAVGASDISLWHNSSKSELDPSFYGSATKLFPNFIKPAALTVGLGNNIYTDAKTTGDLKKKVGGFAAAALYLMPQLSLIADYTGGITTAGVGFVPFPQLPVSFTMGASDLFEYNDSKVSFIAGVSAAYTF